MLQRIVSYYHLYMLVICFSYYVFMDTLHFSFFLFGISGFRGEEKADFARFGIEIERQGRYR